MPSRTLSPVLFRERVQKGAFFGTGCSVDKGPLFFSEIERKEEQFYTFRKRNGGRNGSDFHYGTVEDDDEEEGRSFWGSGWVRQLVQRGKTFVFLLKRQITEVYLIVFHVSGVIIESL